MDMQGEPRGGTTGSPATCCIEPESLSRNKNKDTTSWAVDNMRAPHSRCVSHGEGGYCKCMQEMPPTMQGTAPVLLLIPQSNGQQKERREE